MSQPSNVVPLRSPEEGLLPPHDLGAEAAILSACFVTAAALQRVQGRLEPSHFFDVKHRYVFQAMLACHARGEPLDEVIVASELKLQGRIAQIGGRAFLTSLFNAAPAISGAAIDAYARTVRETARVRDLQVVCRRIAAEGYIEHGEHEAFVAEAERAVVEVARRGREPAPETNLDALKQIVDEISKRSEAARRGDRERLVTGLPTGLQTYDVLTNGLHGGEVTVIGARPGVGKTAIALQIAAHLAGPPANDARPPVGVAFFQLDNMSRKECLTRVLAARSSVPQSAMKTGQLDGDAWDRLTEASAQIPAWPLIIDDRKRVNVLELRARVHRIVGDPRLGRAPLGLVVIDYFQKLVATPDMQRARKHEYLAHAAEGIGHLAGELKIPILLLAQLNRGFEERKEDPEFRDLADCGDLEKEAQVVSFLVAPRTKKRVRAYVSEDTARTLILKKQRNGRREGRVSLEFDGALARFRDVDAAESAPAWVQHAPRGAGDGLPYEQPDDESIDGRYT